MFGCLAIYVKQIVLIVQDKLTNTADNGVWLATTQEHHQSLRREFPNMRSIQVLGKASTGCQVLQSIPLTLNQRHCGHASLWSSRPSDRQNSGRTDVQVRIKSDRKIVEADQKLEKKHATDRNRR